MHRPMHRQSGFTIIELLIATTVFSLVLMVTLAGILQVTKMYYRGVTSIRVQETARAITDEVGESIRYSASSVNIGDPKTGPDIAPSITDSTAYTGYFCVGNKRYTFAIDRQMADSNSEANKRIKHALWVDQPTVCNGAADLSADVPSAGGREMLAEGMRLSRLSLSEVGGFTPARAYRLDVGVIYGDNDLIQNDSTGQYRNCQAGFSGAEFCAFSNLSVTVERRL